ncbi:MAG: hypothetical protein COB69_09950 [Phycisphaera sp.]|nr:MAG: hypothetical protein COB69_09950 [Phycisphaera sp.]
MERLLAGIEERNKSPFQKYTEQLDVLRKMLQSTAIDAERFQSASELLFKEFQDKNTQTGGFSEQDAGQFRSVTLENVALNSTASVAKSVQQVKDPQLETTNGLLNDMNNKLEGGFGAVLT